jgi:starvation-inducible outer membrane lipoprotein
MKRLIVIISIMLAACTTAPTIIEKPADIPIPSDQLAKCSPLQKISNGKTTVNLGELMTYTTSLQQQYTTCATKDDALIDTVSNQNKSSK